MKINRKHMKNKQKTSKIEAVLHRPDAKAQLAEHTLAADFRFLKMFNSKICTQHHIMLKSVCCACIGRVLSLFFAYFLRCTPNVGLRCSAYMPKASTRLNDGNDS